MKRLNAEGAIGLLLGLLIISIIFIMMMPTLKNVSGGAGMSGSSVNQKNVEEQVDKTVNEIQNMRQQTVDYNKKQDREEY